MEDVPNLTGTILIEIGIVWYVSKNRIGIHFRHKKTVGKRHSRTKLNRDKTHQIWDRLVRLEKQNRNKLLT